MHAVGRLARVMSIMFQCFDAGYLHEDDYFAWQHQDFSVDRWGSDYGPVCPKTEPATLIRETKKPVVTRHTKSACVRLLRGAAMALYYLTADNALIQEKRWRFSRSDSFAPSKRSEIGCVFLSKIPFNPERSSYTLCRSCVAICTFCISFFSLNLLKKW